MRGDIATRVSEVSATSSLQIAPWREDENSLDPLTEQVAEVPAISGHEVSTVRGDGGSQYGLVLVGQVHSRWDSRRGSFPNQFDRQCQLRESCRLNIRFEVASRLFEGEAGCHERRVLELPQA